MTAAILANGAFPRKDYPRYLLRSADVVVCCDSATNFARLQRMGIEPVAMVGDMDSASAALRRELGTRAVRVEEQDYNDLNKSFCWLLQNYPQADTVYILGATGKSDAHTLGNLSYLMKWEQDYRLSSKGISVQMVSDYNTVFAISESTELHVGEGRKVSFFSCDPGLKLHSEGLRWPTDSVVFDYWFKATLNRATSDIVSLSLSHPAPLLVVLD